VCPSLVQFTDSHITAYCEQYHVDKTMKKTRV